MSHSPRMPGFRRRRRRHTGTAGRRHRLTNQRGKQHALPPAWQKAAAGASAVSAPRLVSTGVILHDERILRSWIFCH